MTRSRPAPASRANSASRAAKNGLEMPFDMYQKVSPEIGCTKAVPDSPLYRRAFALTHLQPVVVRRFELRPNGSGRRRAGITGQRRPAHLDAAMLAIGGLGRRKRQGGVTEDQLHVFKQRALIALERQHIGAALIGDRSGDLALTGH